MENLDRNDILQMVGKCDMTPLRLHWAADERPARACTARDVSDEVARIAAQGVYTEEEVWQLAYICTEKDYQEEQEVLYN